MKKIKLTTHFETHARQRHLERSSEGKRLEVLQAILAKKMAQKEVALFQTHYFKSA